MHTDSKYNTYKVAALDDNLDDLETIKRHLSHSRHIKVKFTQFTDIGQAKSNLIDDKFDVLFVDQNLDNCEGTHLIEEMGGRNCQTPFVMLTGSADEALYAGALEAGAIGFVSKSDMTPALLEQAILNAHARHEANMVLKHQQKILQNVIGSTDDTGRMKSDIIPQLYHEISTPLNAVIGFSDLLQSAGNGKIPLSKYREYAQFINMSAQTLKQVTSELLELEELQSKFLNINEVKTPAWEFIKKCMDDHMNLRPLTAANDLSGYCLRVDGNLLHTAIDKIITILSSDEAEPIYLSCDIRDQALSLCFSATEEEITPSCLPWKMSVFDVKPDSHITHCSDRVLIRLLIINQILEIHGGGLLVEATKKNDKRTYTKLCLYLPQNRVIKLS